MVAPTEETPGELRWQPKENSAEENEVVFRQGNSRIQQEELYLS